MADFQYGQVNQAVSDNVTIALATLTSRLELISVSTTVDIRSLADSGGTSTSQGNLNKLIQVVSERGQPVIMGDVVATSAPYAIRLVTEHNQGWGSVQGVSGVQLADRLALDGVNYGFAQVAASVTGYIGTSSGTGTANNILTVTAVGSGSLSIGALLVGPSSGTYITGILTGTGGVGTYTVNNSQLLASGTVTSAATTNTITLTSVLT